MEQIKLNDINFHSLQKLKQQGTKATLYKDGNVAFCDLDGCSYNGYIAPFYICINEEIFYWLQKLEIIIII